MTVAEYEQLRSRAQEARGEAKQLRDLHGVATCGLPMRYTGVHYGTLGVATHIAARVADAYLEWADEYDATAERIEAEMAAMLQDGPLPVRSES